MFIKNKKTGLVQECHNKDVIRVCQKDAEHFEVTDENPINIRTEMDSTVKDQKSISQMSVEELRAFAKEKGIEGASSLKKDELLEVLKDVV